MDVRSAILNSVRLKSLFWKGRFGLETERLRVDRDGWLAQSPHPAGLGSKSEHPYITADFSESQLELITPPMNNLQEARGFIQTLLDLVQRELPEGELLWPQSMPCKLPEEEKIPLARFDGDARGRTQYREYLSRIYGRSRQTICGSHFNFSFSPEFLTELATELKQPEDAVREFIYLRTVRNLMRNRWLLVGLLGRSPVAHESLHLKELGSGKLVPVCCQHGVSIRCSAIGYRNPESLPVDYRSIAQYLGGIDTLVKSGKLLNPNELYLPVRIKTCPGSNAVSHIELRIMDIDPNDPSGLPLEALQLMHAMVLFALLKDENEAFDWEQQVHADRLQNQVACCGFDQPADDIALHEGRSLSGLKAMASGLLNEMGDCLTDLIPASMENYKSTLLHYGAVLDDWQNSPVNKLKRQIRSEGFIEFNLRTAGEQAVERLHQDFRFHAYADLELSTQLLLKAAIRRGIGYDILDRRQNFIRLSRGAKQEYVIQATKTSLDRYSTILAMENKKVTKQILRENSISTPIGLEFDCALEAKDSWSTFKNKPVVIKPMNTNFGIGITILKSNNDQQLFESAIEQAFVHDSQIMVERFIEGREFRFFLIEDQVVAILHRVPANITGDGQHSIRELIQAKNQDPLRGKGYVTPLERIAMGEAERQHLSRQGLDFESVPDPGTTIYLRENSNISTGGDSIDYTDRIHPSYSRIASAAANALRVKITGLDMIIQDIQQPAQVENHSIIEMNFNPAIHIHCHPFQGENRRLDERILSALGFV